MYYKEFEPAFFEQDAPPQTPLDRVRSLIDLAQHVHEHFTLNDDTLISGEVRPFREILLLTKSDMIPRIVTHNTFLSVARPGDSVQAVQVLFGSDKDPNDESTDLAVTQRVTIDGDHVDQAPLDYRSPTTGNLVGNSLIYDLLDSIYGVRFIHSGDGDNDDGTLNGSVSIYRTGTNAYSYYDEDITGANVDSDDLDYIEAAIAELEMAVYVDEGGDVMALQLPELLGQGAVALTIPYADLAENHESPHPTTGPRKQHRYN